MASSSSTRPVTSKARGICRYYTEPRGCFAGNKCKFLHAMAQVDPESNDPPLLTSYDQSKRCRYYDAGFCKKGGACWFLHERKDEAVAVASDDEQEELCSICFENPSNFGLLEGCGHIFCIECIKQWRDPQNKPGGLSGNTKKCPMCRAPSRFITPSSNYWRDGTEEKAKTVDAYKESMARVPCRYFKRSLQKNKDRPRCLFGKDCFYQHLKVDGTPYLFKDGVAASMRNYGRHGSGPGFDDFHFLPFSPFSFGLSAIAQPLATLPGLDPLSARNYNPSAPTSTQSDGRRGGNDGLAFATQRLQEVGQSLEMLNDAISGGASLDNLRIAIDALRTGLGRTDHRNAIEEEPSNTERNNMDSDLAREEEDEVMERLEILADQMLASVELLRQGTEPREGVETPPPPLEPIVLTREAVLASLDRRRPNNDSSSDDSMPYLQSVSNTSSGSDVDGDADDNDSDGSNRNLEANSSRVLGLAEMYLEALQRPGDRTPPVDSSRTGSRFSTVVDWDGGSLHGAQADPIDMPGLEPVGVPDPAEDEGSPSPGPFVTDGRGRVVWSSPAEENKVTDGFTTDGRGRVVSVVEESSSESVSELETEPQAEGSSGTSGRSLFGWLNAFF